MRTVTVTGQGASGAVPDVAVLGVAARHRGTTAADAFAGVASAVEALLATVRPVVGEAAVASQDLSLHTRHDDDGRARGFECRQSLSVRCGSLAVASSLLGDLLTALGDRLQLDGISLRVGDASAARAAAREAAYADAVARATALATLAGAVLGEPQSVTEGGSWGTGPDEVASGPLRMSFAAGEQTISISVTVVFALV